MNLPEILKKDHFLTGLIIGLVLPLAFYCILWLLDGALFRLLNFHLTRSHHLLYLLSLAVNLLPVRYYLVKLKFEKTGLGVLLVTAVGVLLYFYLYFQH